MVKNSMKKHKNDKVSMYPHTLVFRPTFSVVILFPHEESGPRYKTRVITYCICNIYIPCTETIRCFVMQLLQRLLNSRQLALKLVANTTFGYTAASYSGRMPCIEIADSIVEKGRETLERAIQLVNSTPKWKGRVVYGDTDSLFVLLKGVSKDEAFQIGKDICARVAEENPKPVKLKFEKVSE